MSSPEKRLPSRSTARSAAKGAGARKRVAKSTRLKPATKRSPAGKARANKATKVASSKKATTKRASAKPAAKSRAKATPKHAPKVTKTPTRRVAAKPILRPVIKKPLPPPPQPTFEEAAALTAFESAHKEFTRGRFAEARNQFRTLIEKYPSVSEVAARARTYLAVSEARLRTDLTPPRDADSLYDRGVIELNRGDYVAAQELFERALKREPEAAHIHYGLAATRARLGAIDGALRSLRSALDLQPKLRIRAQRDLDLNSLRTDPEFDQIVFPPAE
ncbi:MAG TPA: tetratricopeptide repeat protein [Pyrinomonadaceae bacterium]|nr:tetratricopeptide repeat protein [Pyrinomonadaceae bacterium]